ncbi:uncharacterized protein C8A04DRAFT_12334 [Dichotomopilus funicola]|uniref:DUF7600 domain-containing protein n=1 Tax=Dichotomopilus funicola TaxID=1934379 RepID=A0AAN6V284_9PEZI|nr:hypothetical protein C8A04DRAFT_12334 [Dichotomopilus funicola]
MYSFYVDLNVSVTTQRNWQLGEGFVFHDACWRLLQEVFYPLPIPLERLLDVFRSLPSESTLSAQPAFWGHDYGGVALINTGDYFPWEVSPFFAPPAPASFGLPGSDPVFEDDPSQTVGFHHLVQLNSKAPEQPHIALRRAATQPSRPSAKDPFLALPKELCNAIAVLLPTADALRARLVSRAFWPIFYDQHFWISRFKAPRSRSWLFEARDGPATDWRSLYRRTRDNAHLPRDLINRRRIWGLLKQVESIVALTWHPLPPSLPQEWSFDAAVNDTHPGHVHNEVGGLFSHSFGMGCTLLTEQKVAIPKLLERLSIHIASFGGEVHVVGMSFATATDTVHLGYSSSSVQSVQVKELWGFRVALGFRGIRGLQCVTGPGESESPWLGSLDDTLQTDRLVTGGRVIGIVVGFDAGKIVSLTTKTRLPSSGMKCPGQSGLRDSSLWYPSVPSQTVSLNDDTFVLQDYGEIGFKPLFHCHFGGPGGVYLRHLIGITGVKSRGSLLRIVFSFDRPVPEAHQRFGRSRVRSNEATASFAIDGPRGERIVAIKINYLAYRSALREEIDSFVQRFEVCLFSFILISFTLA